MKKLYLTLIGALLMLVAIGQSKINCDDLVERNDLINSAKLVDSIVIKSIDSESQFTITNLSKVGEFFVLKLLFRNNSFCSFEKTKANFIFDNEIFTHEVSLKKTGATSIMMAGKDAFDLNNTLSAFKNSKLKAIEIADSCGFIYLLDDHQAKEFQDVMSCILDKPKSIKIIPENLADIHVINFVEKYGGIVLIENKNEGSIKIVQISFTNSYSVKELKSIIDLSIKENKNATKEKKWESELTGFESSFWIKDEYVIVSIHTITSPPQVSFSYEP